VPEGHKDVLFVFDEPGAWTRYRCEHQGEQLALLGATSDISQSSQVDLLRAVDHYDCFILNRVQWRDEVAAFLESARSLDRLVVFDTDDLIFEPELIQHFAIFEGWPEDERTAEFEKLERYQRTLRACDAAIVTTEPLAAHARRHTAHVEVVFNAVSQEMVRLSDAALASSSHKEDPSVVTIAYLSGTRTHNRDFLEAADAVLWALDAYPEVRFRAVGKLELDQRFDRFGGRVERIPIQPWQTLPELVSRVQVNLAPLERDNPVTECKSCVKYLEAGLVGIPTIASARNDFMRVIEHGRNGFLADSSQEWQEALRQLIESAQMRREIGELAYEETRRHHMTRARATLFGEALTRLGSPANRRETRYESVD
jgi:glycosyltransferase involved in cell wall biosynthesis